MNGKFVNIWIIISVFFLFLYSFSLLSFLFMTFILSLSLSITTTIHGLVTVKMVVSVCGSGPRFFIKHLLSLSDLIGICCIWWWWWVFAKYFFWFFEFLWILVLTGLGMWFCCVVCLWLCSVVDFLHKESKEWERGEGRERKMNK